MPLKDEDVGSRIRQRKLSEHDADLVHVIEKWEEEKRESHQLDADLTK